MAQQTASDRTLWQYFPWMVAGGLAIVVAVNATMAVLAHRSAPGLAVQGSFATSNAYGTIQAEARRQIGLGWSLDVAVRDGRVEVRLADARGAALPGAAVQAIATRPVANYAPIDLGMGESTAGLFRSDIALPGQGQWDVLFVATSHGRTFRHTRRIHVP
jgi:nitrogen fixation protein FixH